MDHIFGVSRIEREAGSDEHGAFTRRPITQEGPCHKAVHKAAESDARQLSLICFSAGGGRSLWGVLYCTLAVALSKSSWRIWVRFLVDHAGCSVACKHRHQTPTLAYPCNCLILRLRPGIWHLGSPARLGRPISGHFGGLGLYSARRGI
jgi:hypothetical protein